jgi:2-polyprenyl-6-methoxyphenol hydroxylase-like FAD-dependent oxidoreductase
MLRNLALQEGVEIRQNANVVQADADSVSVRLETGDVISGDIIVLANASGSSSKLRSSVSRYPKDLPLEAAPRVLSVAFTVFSKMMGAIEDFWSLQMPVYVFIHSHDILHSSSLFISG